MNLLESLCSVRMTNIKETITSIILALKEEDRVITGGYHGGPCHKVQGGFPKAVIFNLKDELELVRHGV